MNEEEKQVIDYFENLDISLNTLCRIDLKGLEKRRKQILKLVEKQQNQIKKLNIENQALYELQNIGDNDLLIRTLKEKDEEIEELKFANKVLDSCLNDFYKIRGDED